MVRAKKGYHFGGSVGHHNLMIRNLVVSLLTHERLRTTQAKAREMRPVVDKVISLAKKGDLASRRLILAEIDNEQAVYKLFSEIVPRYSERDSGFTRVVKIGPRTGDAAPMVQIELV
jgi:large subunit ribosomal protein L17